ncbi:MAG: PLP-dependent transferase [Planctomycetes bacterium]|nr:PLP-dependent transferase [Planctomycetota bacterium]
MKKKTSVKNGFQTRCVWEEYDPCAFEGSMSPPIYQSSLFAFDDYDTFVDAMWNQTSHMYSRVTNPTRDVLEKKLAALEGGDMALAFASGTAAIAAAIFSRVKAGDHVIAPYFCYGETYRILATYLPKFNVHTTFIYGRDIREFEKAIRPNTKLIYLESPSSMYFHIQPIKEAVALAKKHGIKTIIDNSNATPYNQLPLKMGVDFVLHSMSKYFSGHSDVVAGVLIGPEKEMKSIRIVERELLGNMLGPFESWLVLRGLRTLGVRMKTHNESAMKIAEFLEGRPEIEQVYYAGLKSHPQHELAKKQMTGFSSLITLRVRGGEKGLKKFISGLKLFKMAVSWGGFDSLIVPVLNPPKKFLPTKLTNTDKVRRSLPGTARIAVGLEDMDDLIKDLDRALNTK